MHCHDLVFVSNIDEQADEPDRITGLALALPLEIFEGRV
jgi:hypothetical protein